MYIIDKTNRSHSRSLNRSHDYLELAKEAKTNPDPEARKLAERAIHDIKNEDKHVRGMREALIKAHRQNNQTEIKDIHDIVAHKRKYRHE